MRNFLLKSKLKVLKEMQSKDLKHPIIEAEALKTPILTLIESTLSKKCLMVFSHKFLYLTFNLTEKFGRHK